MSRAPLLVPAVGLLAGIAGEQRHLFAFVLLAIASVFALAAVAGRFGPRLAAAAAAALAGLVVSATHGHPATIERDAHTARYAALVVGDVREADGVSGTALAIDGIGIVRASLRDAVVPGERLVVRGRLEPFDEPRNPGEPSLREIERDAGFAGRLATVRILSRAGIDERDPRAWAARLRARASAILRTRIPEPSATILAGALWGERGALPDDLHDAFQVTGTVHVLVTAGLHLGVIAALLVFLGTRAGFGRISVALIAIAGIAAYVWFSGAHLPSQRAAVMIGVALSARACGVRIVSWNAVALAAIVVAVAWPVAVTSASFALSFSCIAAIVLFAKPIAAALAVVPVHHRVHEALALTCATQLGTWPLTAAIFSTLAPYAILANAFVVPLVAIALPGGVATFVFPFVAPLETLVLLAIERIVRLVAALPGAHVTLRTPSLAAIAAYDACALLAAYALHAGRVRVAVALLTAGTLAVLAPAFVRLPHGLTITSLDVGQADAAVIRTPDDHIILIDTGGELERGRGNVSTAERAGARVVLAYLRREGITRVDLMILSHPHGDHVGAAAPIIESMPVGMIFDSGQTYAGRAYRDAVAAAHIHSVPIVLARRGMRWSSGDGVTLDVLAPSSPFLADTGDDINENSIVTMLRANGFRELFMGDAGEASEARILASGNDLHADVVKVGHHGSRYASTPAFVAAIHPSIAVISVGRHNTFGHPAPATIESWSDTGADIIRTDLCGAISLVSGSATVMLPQRCTIGPAR